MLWFLGDCNYHNVHNISQSYPALRAALIKCQALRSPAYSVCHPRYYCTWCSCNPSYVSAKMNKAAVRLRRTELTRRCNVYEQAISVAIKSLLQRPPPLRQSWSRSYDTSQSETWLVKNPVFAISFNTTLLCTLFRIAHTCYFSALFPLFDTSSV